MAEQLGGALDGAAELGSMAANKTRATPACNSSFVIMHPSIEERASKPSHS
ncbi:MAG TPA: hypothetical protein VNF99_19070 [Stellaceae bacterium]|nr:hypothetical protein [Stellaceae bacterium]